MVVLAAVCRHSTPQLTVSHTAAHCSSATSMLLSRPHPSLFISFLYLFSANLSVSRCKARQFLGLSTAFTCQYTLSTETLLFPLYCSNTSFDINYALRNRSSFFKGPANIMVHGGGGGSRDAL